MVALKMKVLPDSKNIFGINS